MTPCAEDFCDSHAAIGSTCRLLSEALEQPTREWVRTPKPLRFIELQFSDQEVAAISQVGEGARQHHQGNRAGLAGTVLGVLPSHDAGEEPRKRRS